MNKHMDYTKLNCNPAKVKSDTQEKILCNIFQELIVVDYFTHNFNGYLSKKQDLWKMRTKQNSYYF